MVLKNNKALGQNWLYDREILEYIAGEAADLDGPKLCLEIGPGLGTLTAHLLRHFSKVVAVEFDSRLADNLPRSFPGKNLTVINEDILRFDFGQIDEPYVVAGNIPYYITSPIIEKLLSLVPAAEDGVNTSAVATNGVDMIAADVPAAEKNVPASRKDVSASGEIVLPPEKIVLLVQKEVADRATPVKNRENLLSLSIKNRAHALRGRVVEKNLFTPPPKVDSEVLILLPHAALYPDATLSLAKIGFASPRKKLLGNLTRGLQKEKAVVEAAFAKIKLEVDARPADLSLDDWNNLRKELTL